MNKGLKFERYLLYNKASGYKSYSCLTQLSIKCLLLIKTLLLKNKDFLAFNL